MDYSDSNSAVWGILLTFGLLALAILLCDTLRRSSKLVRKSLLPVAVLAGVLLLILKETDVLQLNVNLLSIVCYHAVAVGFIAMALRVPKESERIGGVMGIRAGALAAATYMLQVVVGVGIALVLANTLKPGLFEPSGMLLAYGFGQGPGQANNIGATFEMQGFEGGTSFGLALAAAGYLAAFVGGILALHVARRKRTSIMEEHDVTDYVTVETFQDAAEAPVNDSVDRFSIQLCLVLAVYLGTFLLLKLFSQGIALVAGGSVADSLSATLWGFNFLMGVLAATAVRGVLQLLQKKGITHTQVQNNYLLSRISGTAFDFMIVAGIAAIDIRQIAGMWLPFVLMAAVGAIATFFFLRIITRRAFDDFADEAFLVMYGTWTGTVSSGMILLREIDPGFRTPAANAIIIGSSYAIVLGAPLLLITAWMPSNVLLWFGISVAYFAVLLLIVLFRTGKKHSQ